MTEHDVPRRSPAFWVRIVIVFATISACGDIAALILRLCEPSPPTLHTRRITVGDKTVSLEIPDGQCASALGVTICVPDSSSRKVSP